MFTQTCQPEDKICCRFCAAIRRADQLDGEDWHKFPKSDQTGSYWPSWYYYCPCDSKHPLLYDCGDGVLQVVEGNAELITLVSEKEEVACPKLGFASKPEPALAPVS